MSLFDSRLQILEQIGSGGSSEVYLVKHLQLDKLVAVKLLQSKYCDEAGTRRFLREARVLCQLRHSNIVELYACEKNPDGRLYMVMEFIEGASLAQELKKEKPSLDRAVNIWLQVCRGMSKAHDAGIVHRGLKPSNIMLHIDSDGSEVAKIVDFGIARVTEHGAAQSHTQTDSIVGSPSYMSPEQCSGGDIDARSDIYSLGCVMYECLAGRAPFVDENVYSLLSKQVNDTASELPADVPGGLASIVTKAMRKSPADRYQTMQELSDALEQGRESHFAGAKGAKRSAWRKTSRGAKVFFAGTMVVSTLVLLWFAKLGLSKQNVHLPVLNQEADQSNRIIGRTLYAPMEARKRRLADHEQGYFKLYKRWIEQNPNVSSLLMGRAYFYLSEESVACHKPASEVLAYRERARSCLESVLSEVKANGTTLSAEDFFELHRCFALLDEAEGKFESAEMHYRVRAESSLKQFLPEAYLRGESWDSLGLFYYRRSRFGEAVKPFDVSLETAVLRHSPLYEFRIRRDLSACLFFSGQTSRAIKEAQIARKLIPSLEPLHHCDLYVQNAGTFDMCGQYSEAAKSWDRALSGGMDKHLPNTLMRAASSFVRCNDYSKAEKLSLNASERMVAKTDAEQDAILAAILNYCRGYPAAQSQRRISHGSRLLEIVMGAKLDVRYYAFLLALYHDAGVPPPLAVQHRSLKALDLASSTQEVKHKLFLTLARELADCGQRNETLRVLEQAMVRLRAEGNASRAHKVEVQIVAARILSEPTGSAAGNHAADKAKAVKLVSEAAHWLFLHPGYESAISLFLESGTVAANCGDFVLAEKLQREAMTRGTGATQVRAVVALATSLVRWGAVEPGQYKVALDLIDQYMQTKSFAESGPALQARLYRVKGCALGSLADDVAAEKAFDKSLDLNNRAYPPELEEQQNILDQRKCFLDHSRKAPKRSERI